MEIEHRTIHHRINLRVREKKLLYNECNKGRRQLFARIYDKRTFNSLFVLLTDLCALSGLWHFLFHFGYKWEYKSTLIISMYSYNKRIGHTDKNNDKKIVKLMGVSVHLNFRKYLSISSLFSIFKLTILYKVFFWTKCFYFLFLHTPFHIVINTCPLIFYFLPTARFLKLQRQVLQ